MHSALPCIEVINALLQFIEVKPGSNIDRQYNHVSKGKYIFTSKTKILASYSTGPLPPSNLSAVLVTTSTVHLNWDTPPADSVDGYTLNVTHNHSTKSRYVPNGKMTSYTVRDLQPGQRYRITVTALRNTPQGPVNSDPKTLRIQTGK